LFTFSRIVIKYKVENEKYQEIELQSSLLEIYNYNLNLIVIGFELQNFSKILRVQIIDLKYHEIDFNCNM